ncbi:hypothetical protein [Streptomyces collinus]|uniref:hypothetical protein n=1 Tax=Streptomyces collinus TaxID=42684 RepID=UPI0036EF79BD
MPLRTHAALGLACAALLTGCATAHTTTTDKPPRTAVPSIPSSATGAPGTAATGRATADTAGAGTATADTASAGTATAGTASAGTASAGTDPATTAAAPTGTSAARSPFHRAPELDPDDILAGRQEPITGSASFTYTGGRKGDTLILAVRCQGGGTVEVTVHPVHVAFPVRCPADRADTVHHEVRVTGTARGGTASVRAPSTVRWAMTIGRTRS